jgi:Flp pilus assembly protein TadG
MIRAMTRTFPTLRAPHSLSRDQQGSSVVEFALILPILMVALIGIVDYGMMVFANTELENAARTGAQYALQGVDEADDDAGIEAAARAALSDDTGVTINISRACLCPDGSASACTDTCTADELEPGRYVTVNMRLDFTPIFGHIVSDPTQLGSEAILRIE